MEDNSKTSTVYVDAHTSPSHPNNCQLRILGACSALPVLLSWPGGVQCRANRVRDDLVSRVGET